MRRENNKIGGDMNLGILKTNPTVDSYSSIIARNVYKIVNKNQKSMLPNEHR